MKALKVDMTRKQCKDLKEMLLNLRYNPELKTYPKEATTKEDFEKLDWAKFKIVVPTEEDAKKVRMALKYLHDSDIDTNHIWVNQIVHAYEGDNSCLIVDKDYDVPVKE